MLTGNLEGEHRLEWIRARLDAGEVVLIRETASRLGVSDMTVRRDLRELEALGVARRIRGGALPAGPVAFANRQRRNARAKARIAAKLLPIVPETGAIGIDASSTMLRLATAIPGGRDLTIITNGRDTFDVLQGKPGIRPVLTGGEVDPRTGSLVGPFALRSADSLLLSHLFMSCAAVDAAIGCSEAALEEALIKQMLARVADTVILGVDASKLDTRAVAMGFRWEEVSYLVTDLDPDSPKLARYRSLATVL